MTGRRAKLSLVLSIFASVILLVGGLLSSRPTSAQAPTSPPVPPVQPAADALPPGYVGAETCKTCHEEAFRKFETTKMGRLFLKHPRSAQERLACETCHGPGEKHAAAGGGKGVGGMITFAKNDPTPVGQRNAMCTTCHSKGDRIF